MTETPALLEHLPELVVIGHIRTPWKVPRDCPYNPMESDSVCRVDLLPRWKPATASLEGCSHVFLLYWLDRADRERLVQTPVSDNQPHGVFALRSPNRPNPIGLSVVDLVKVEEGQLAVRHVDCLDGTPLLDIKPYFPSIDSKPDATVDWWEKRTNPTAPRAAS